MLLNLVPPSLFASTEVLLSPGGEEDLSRFIVNITVGKGQRKRSRSTNNGPVGGVLRSVAGAQELVGSSGPGDDATQVSAYCKTERAAM